MRNAYGHLPPASLVDLRRVKDLGAFMGTRIEARVIEMDRNRNNVVLSRRIVLEETVPLSFMPTWSLPRMS